MEYNHTFLIQCIIVTIVSGWKLFALQNIPPQILPFTKKFWSRSENVIWSTLVNLSFNYSSSIFQYPLDSIHVLISWCMNLNGPIISHNPMSHLSSAIAHTSLHYFWLLVLPHYIFLKCYNFLLFKIFFTKGIDINTLQTQESVYTWLVKIFINYKNL
jgi:hypothetical protein